MVKVAINLPHALYKGVINIHLPEFQCDDSKCQRFQSLQDNLGEASRYLSALAPTWAKLAVSLLRV